MGALPAALEAELLEQMRALDAYQLIAELRAYTAPSVEVRKVRVRVRVRVRLWLALTLT